MNFIVHLIYTLILARILELDIFNFWLAIIFGVLVDLDHLYYYLKNKKLIQVGYKHRTFMQEPVFLPIIVVISLILWTPVPILFFLLHLILDYIMGYEKKPFWPFSNLTLKKGIKSYGLVYWLITLISIILFVVFYLYNSEYFSMLY